MSLFDPALPPVVTDRVIRLEQLGMAWVHRRRFQGCHLVGPRPALLAGCFIQNSRWLGLEPQRSFVIVPDPTDRATLPDKTISFVECTFDNCEFENFVAVGSEQQIGALRRLFGL